MFLPFSGCRTRCIFCSQEAQTGRRSRPVPLLLAQAEAELRDRAARTDAPFELAFYGGSFTALAEEELSACLNFAARWMRAGLVAGFRCSTRPDAVDWSVSARLRSAGCSTVELGVQSFADSALALCGRAYSGGQAREACTMLREAGLQLGVQLLPGMPGLCPELAQQDVQWTARLGPDCVRLYPCLVLRDTALEHLWRQGGYRPWELEETLDYLASACLSFWQAGVPVIRMGLADEPGLAGKVLAGPRHPCLGGRARARALYLYIRELVQGFAPDVPQPGLLLAAPRRAQGEFWGWKGELAPLYAELGLGRGRVCWWDKEHFALGVGL
ncbi:radical SAM protein [Desulfovibrio sp. OttesenSCG-928-A18]|nr:radical SAM protein [Desulfovibrio sp. OttesenSCG-928-A18]